MPRIPKRLLALGGLAAAGGAVLRRRRAGRPTAPTPSASAPTPSPAPTPTPTPTPEPAPPVSTAGTTVASPIVVTPPARPIGGGDDALVLQEEAAAAAEAAGIGGPRLDDAHGNPAMEAVYEAGGGEAEGFELAEEQLIENATHGDGRGDPSQDAFTPEREADEVTGFGGEADEAKVSEVVEDPSAEPDDPGAGPGITHER